MLGLEQSVDLRTPQPGGIHKQHDVGGTIGPFRFHPLNQLLVSELDPVDLDSGLLREVVVQRVMVW